MTRSLGQVAYEARWFFKRSLRRWSDERLDTQRRYEEAAHAVVAANSTDCLHSDAVVYEGRPPALSPPSQLLFRLFWCRACGALRHDYGSQCGPWLAPRRL